jgi:SAM-dependent methyltransferase
MNVHIPEIRSVTALHSAMAPTDWINECPCCRGGFRSTPYKNIVRCLTCNVWFVNPRPTQDEIARIYDTDKTYREWGGDEAARQAMWERRLRLIKRFHEPGILLDIGAGDGAFMQGASRAGWIVHGTEISAAGVRRTGERGFKIWQGSFTELPLRDTQFDLVTMWHVLEHVPDSLATVRNALRILKPQGLLVVAVPNRWHGLIQRLTGRGTGMIRGEFQPGDEVHLTCFDPFSLQRLIRQNGFRLLEFGVDDVDLRRAGNRPLKNAVLKGMSAFGWHLGQAMYVVAQKQ